MEITNLDVLLEKPVQPIKHFRIAYMKLEKPKYKDEKHKPKKDYVPKFYDVAEFKYHFVLGTYDKKTNVFTWLLIITRESFQRLQKYGAIQVIA